MDVEVEIVEILIKKYNGVHGIVPSWPYQHFPTIGQSIGSKLHNDPNICGTLGLYVSVTKHGNLIERFKCALTNAHVLNSTFA
jgi:hypothetical protein